VDGVGYAICPRRTVLDLLLVRAARKAGVEVREGFTVEEVLVEGETVVGVRGHLKNGKAAERRARIVVGADGQHSLVAKAVRAERYNEQPTLSVAYYAYWRGLPVERFEGYIRPRRAFAVAPTSDGLTMGVINWPRADFEANQDDVEGHFMRAVETAPALHARFRHATRESRFLGTPDLPNFFRKPYGPGWVLVGDAGYHKDPITAQGISDAFRERRRHGRHAARGLHPRGGRSTRPSRAISGRGTTRRCRCSPSPASSRTWPSPSPQISCSCWRRCRATARR
jgi:flavin-dependent dehydrogenase